MLQNDPGYYDRPIKEFIYSQIFSGQTKEIEDTWFDNVPVSIKNKFESIKLFFEDETPLYLSFKDLHDFQYISDIRILSFKNQQRGEVFWKDFKSWEVKGITITLTSISPNNIYSNATINTVSFGELFSMMHFLREMKNYLEYHIL